MTYNTEMEPGPEKLGNLLRERRQELGLTLENVETATRKTGTRVSAQFLSDTERAYARNGGAVTKPSDAKLRALSQVLDIPLGELHAALGRGEEGTEHPALAYLRGLPDRDKERALRVLEATIPYGPAGAPPPAAPLEAAALAAALERRARMNSPDLRRVRGVTWMLDPAGRFLMSEGGGLSDLSLRPGQVVGLRVEDVYKDSPEFLEKVRMVIASDSPLDWTATVRGQPWHCWTEPLRDAGGRKVGIVGVSLEAPPEELEGRQEQPAQRRHA